MNDMDSRMTCREEEEERPPAAVTTEQVLLACRIGKDKEDGMGIAVDVNVQDDDLSDEINIRGAPAMVAFGGERSEGESGVWGK